MVRAFSRIQRLAAALAVILVAAGAATPIISRAQAKPGAATPTEKKTAIQIRLEEAEQKFVDKKYAEALKDFEEINRDDNKDQKKRLNTSSQPEELRAFIQLRLASCFFYLRNWPEAEKGLIDFLDKFPNGTGELIDATDNFRGNAQITLADVYTRQQKWDQALVLLNKLSRDMLGLRSADRTRATIMLTRVLEARNAKAGADVVKKTAEENIGILLPLIASKNYALPEVKDVGNRLIEVYTKAGDIKSARSLQEEMANRGRGTPLEIVNANFQRIEMGDQLFQSADTEGMPERREQLYRQALTAYQETLRRSNIEFLIDKAVEEKQKAADAVKAQYGAKPTDPQQEIIDKAEAEKETFVKTAEAFKNNKDYDAFISFRIGLCLQSLGRDWEAYIAFKDILDNSPNFKGISAAYYWYILVLKNIHRLKEAQELCREYLKKYPHENETPAIAMMVGEISFEDDDYVEAVKQFRWVRENVKSLKVEEKEQIDWYIVAALFSNAEWEEAYKAIEEYLAKYPKSSQLEQMYYMRGLTLFYQGKNKTGTLGAFKYYTDRVEEKKFRGDFLPDAAYRIAVVEFGTKADNAEKEQEQIKTILDRCNQWLKDYKDKAPNQQSEIYTLLGDTYVRMQENKRAVKEWNTPEAKAQHLRKALEYYVLAAKNARYNQQALDYSTKELNKRLPALGEWAQLLDIYVTLYQWEPESPKSLGYLYWIIRASEKIGKTEQEKRAAIAKAKVKVPDEFVMRSAEELLADVISKNINDPRKENVEQLITELAVRLVRGARNVLKDPAIINKPDLEAQIEKLLKSDQPNASLIAKARGYYARSEVARLMNNEAHRVSNLTQIARIYKAEELSPTILGTVGDYLLAKGDIATGEPYFQYILDHFRSSDFADFGFAGKAEILVNQGKYRDAYELASEAVDNDILLTKEKEVMVARSRALLGLGEIAASGKIDGSTTAIASRINAAAIPYTESKIKDTETILAAPKDAAAKKTAAENLEIYKKQLATLKANANGLAGAGPAVAQAASNIFFDFAVQGFTDIASNRSWRGESTAWSLYYLGQIEEKRGKPEEAIVYYRRCYLTWKKYGNVTAKSYLRIAELFKQKGDTAGARDTLKVMLADPAASTQPEASEARKLQATL